MSPLRIGVIGLGAMGSSHLRAWSEIDSVDVVAVCDPRAGVVEGATRNRMMSGYTEYTDMLSTEGLDGVSVAVPTTLHAEVAIAAINRNVSVLIEKPLAGSSAEAHEIIDAASASNVVVTVGHIERFNPAIRELQRRLALGDLGRIYSLRAERTGPTAFRIQDAGVILDMATHDLDIARLIVNSPVRSLFAAVSGRPRSSAEDLLVGMLSFEDGTIGLLDVNWLSPTKTRRLTILGEKGMFLVDYLRQDLYFYDNSLASSLEFEALATIAGVSEGDMVKIHVSRGEPLRLELEAFANAILYGRSPPVSLKDGLAAVWLAEKAKLSAALGAPVVL